MRSELRAVCWVAGKELKQNYHGWEHTTYGGCPQNTFLNQVPQQQPNPGQCALSFCGLLLFFSFFCRLKTGAVDPSASAVRA